MLYWVPQSFVPERVAKVTQPIQLFRDLMPANDFGAVLRDLDTDVPGAVADDLGPEDLLQHVEHLGVCPKVAAGVPHDGSVLGNHS